MPKIFISHASANNAEALALRDWLVARGWDDLFLDIDPARGLVSGQHWLERLQESAGRCKAVLFVLSPAWLASPYCVAELWEARKRERPLFAVVVDDIAIADLPAEMRGVWQLTFLNRGSRFTTFAVLPPPDYAPSTVRFSHEGLERLWLGLAQAGLTSFDTTSFPWPAPGFEREADGATPRRPYRGLEPVDVPDAGIFFGRDADLVRAREHLAELRDRGGRCIVVLLGASGSGKSSFLRAGLLPRLARDDRRFLPLPVLRPRNAAMWGEEGWLAALETAHRQAGRVATRAALRADLQAGGAGFLCRFVDLRSAAAADLPPHSKPPTLVLPIDQIEELFTTVRGVPADEIGASEARLFLARLAEMLRHGPEALALVTIRSDSYEPLQTAAALQGIPQLPFNLPPIAAADYRSVIEGPAHRVDAAGRPLVVEPALASLLLADTQGADALPLLGFTLERLYIEHGGGLLSRAGYDAMGGVQGSIEAAVAAAFADPGSPPRIPAGAAEREALLKLAFVPHLMGVNEANGEPVRRSARLSDLPTPARGLIDRLIARRLLVVDRPASPDGAGETVVEVAHEALLRRWPTLRRWHDQERAALAIQQEIARAAAAWNENARGRDWLAHRGARLAEAEAVMHREDFAAVFAGVPRAYLAACRESEESLRATEALRLSRQRTLQRRIGALLALVSMVIVAGGWLVLAGRRELARQRLRLTVVNAQEALAGGQPERALRLALVASRESSWPLSPSVDASIQLGRAAYASSLEATLTGHTSDVASAFFSADGQRIVTASDDGTARVWSRGEGGAWRSVVLDDRRGPVVAAALFPDGSHLVTESPDGTARQWSESTDHSWHTVVPGVRQAAIRWAHISPNGRHVVTLSDDRTARVWNRGADGTWQSALLQGHQGLLISTIFSADGAALFTLSPDRTTRVWSRGADGSWRSVALEFPHGWIDTAPPNPYPAAGQPPIVPTLHPADGQGSTISALYPVDGGCIVTSSADGAVRVLSLSETGAWQSAPLSAGGDKIKVVALALSPGGQQIVAGSPDGSLLLGLRTGSCSWSKPLVENEHVGTIYSVSFSADGAYIVTGLEDGTVQVWSQEKGGISLRSTFLRGHQSWVGAMAFSPDGTHLVTASHDHTARVWSRLDDGAWSSAALEGPWDIFLRPPNSVWVWSRDDHGVWTRVTLESHLSGLRSASYSPAGANILALGKDSSAEVWSRGDDGNWHSSLLQGHKGQVNSALFSPDGAHIATASDDGTTRVWSRGDDRAWHSISLRQGSFKVSSAAFSPDGALIVTASGRRALVWNQGKDGSWSNVSLDGHAGTVTSASFSPDGRHILTTSNDKTARLWTRGQNRAWQSVALFGHEAPVTSASFSPDGAQILTAASDDTVLLWSRQGQGHAWTAAPLASASPFVSTENETSASFSPDGTRVVTLSSTSFNVWSRGEDGAWSSAPVGDFLPLPPSFAPDGAHLTWGAFSPDGKHLVTTSSFFGPGLWSIRWLMGPGDWAKTEQRSLAETACREKLRGSWSTFEDPHTGRTVERIGERLLTADDIKAAPILAGHEGEDVCEPFLHPRPWWTRLALWR
jgi:WD40 repeat protein